MNVDDRPCKSAAEATSSLHSPATAAYVAHLLLPGETVIGGELLLAAARNDGTEQLPNFGVSGGLRQRTYLPKLRHQQRQNRVAAFKGGGALWRTPLLRHPLPFGQWRNHLVNTLHVTSPATKTEHHCCYAARSPCGEGKSVCYYRRCLRRRETAHQEGSRSSEESSPPVPNSLPSTMQRTNRGVLSVRSSPKYAATVAIAERERRTVLAAEGLVADAGRGCKSPTLPPPPVTHHRKTGDDGCQQFFLIKDVVQLTPEFSL
nr:hypothetical protein Iba_chr13eCG7950 [Ipomoea batatas]